jgi:YfiR/HmsC-like
MVPTRPLVPRLILCALLLASPATGRTEAIAREYDVKAAFLYNFTKFVDWPPSAFHDDRSSLRLCVLGEDPFGGSLQTIVKEEVAGRKITVLRSGWISDPSGCQILFVSRSEEKRLTQILATVRGAPVLTVGDVEGFLEKGGIINFTLQGSKIRFEINQESADRAGIKISSKLLRLATRIVSGSRTEA